MVMGDYTHVQEVVGLNPSAIYTTTALFRAMFSMLQSMFQTEYLTNVGM